MLKVKVKWDMTGVLENDGWLIEFPGGVFLGPAPRYYHLKRNVSDRKLAEMVRATARYEGIKLPKEFEMSIQD